MLPPLTRMNKPGTDSHKEQYIFWKYTNTHCTLIPRPCCPRKALWRNNAAMYWNLNTYYDVDRVLLNHLHISILCCWRIRWNVDIPPPVLEAYPAVRNKGRRPNRWQLKEGCPIRTVQSNTSNVTKRVEGFEDNHVITVKRHFTPDRATNWIVNKLIGVICIDAHVVVTHWIGIWITLDKSIVLVARFWLITYIVASATEDIDNYLCIALLRPRISKVLVSNWALYWAKYIVRLNLTQAPIGKHNTCSLYCT